MKECRECNGNRKVPCFHCYGSGKGYGKDGKCNYCKGDGEATCPECNGTGKSKN